MTAVPPWKDADLPADDRIIGAALALIATDGLGAVTMVSVAETAGVARQTLYNHYPDIDSIVAEAINRHNQASVDLLESALSVVDGPEERLEQLVRHVVSTATQAHHAPGIEQGLSADARAMLGGYTAALDGHILHILEQGRASGGFRGDLVPEVDAILIRHVLNGLAEEAAKTPATAAELVATGTKTLLAAVGRA